MHASNNAATEKHWRKVWNNFLEAQKLSNNSKERTVLNLMLVQEIYSEGMVVVKHGGSPIPALLGWRNSSSLSLLLKEVDLRLERIDDEKGYGKLVDHANGTSFYL